MVVKNLLAWSGLALFIFSGLACKFTKPGEQTKTKQQLTGGPGASSYSCDLATISEPQPLNTCVYKMGDDPGSLSETDTSNGDMVPAQLKLLSQYKNCDATLKEPMDDVQKFYVAMLKPLEALDGIVYRLRKILRASDPLFAGLSGFLRGINYRKDFIGNHIYQQLIFITRPNKQEPTFENFSSFQTWLQGTSDGPNAGLKGVLQESLVMLESLPENFQFKLDMALFAGESIGSEKIQMVMDDFHYRVFNRYNLDYVISQFERTIAVIDLMSAYNFDKAFNTDGEPNFFNSLIGTYLKSTILNFVVHRQGESEVPLLSPENIIRHWRETPEFQDLGTLKAGGEVLLSQALTMFQKSIDSEIRAWQGYLAHKDSLAQRSLADAVSLGKTCLWNPVDAATQPNILTKLQTHKSILSDSGFAVTSVTGETVRLDIPRLFSAKGAIKDLKSILPTEFVQGDDILSADDPSAPDHDLFNYRKGKPVKWDSIGYTMNGALVNANEANFIALARAISLDPNLSMFARIIPVAKYYTTW